MLRELPATRQIPGEQRRKWFVSAKCDLIVWLGDDESIEGFQFCYDKHDREHALTWARDLGFSHMRVDSGDDFPRHKRTPILVANGIFDANRVLEAFRAESQSLPAEYAAFVSDRLRELANGDHR